MLRQIHVKFSKIYSLVTFIFVPICSQVALQPFAIAFLRLNLHL